MVLVVLTKTLFTTEDGGRREDIWQREETRGMALPEWSCHLVRTLCSEFSSFDEPIVVASERVRQTASTKLEATGGRCCLISSHLITS